MYTPKQDEYDSTFWLIIHCLVATFVISSYIAIFQLGRTFYDGGMDDQYGFFLLFLQNRGLPAALFMVTFPIAFVMHAIKKHRFAQRITIASFIIFFFELMIRIS